MLFDVRKVNCKGDCECDENGNWLLPKSSVEKIESPDHNHAYILPDNEVLVLDHASKELVSLKGKDGEKGDMGPKGEKGDRGETGATINYTSGVGISIENDKISNVGQVVKVTKDDGKPFITVGDDETILKAVLSAGSGYYSGIATDKVADAPEKENTRLYINMIEDFAGSVIAISRTGNLYTRSIDNNQWLGGWHDYNANAMVFQSLQIKAENWNTLKNSGIHWVAGATGTNRPQGLLPYGYLEVFNSVGAITQRYTSSANETATRYYSPSADEWSAWVNNLNNTTGVTINGSQTVTGTKDFLRGGLKVEGREVQVGYSILTTLSDLAVDSSFIDLTGTLSRVGNTVHLAAQFRIDKFTGEAKDLMQIPVGYQREPRNPTNLPLNLIISDPTAKEHVEAFITTSNIVKMKNTERSGTYVLSGSWTTINRFPT